MTATDAIIDDGDEEESKVRLVYNTVCAEAMSLTLGFSRRRSSS